MAGRKPFDPAAMSAGAWKQAATGQGGLFDEKADVAGSPEGKSRRSPITVSQLVRRIKAALHEALPRTIHLIGEISDLSRPESGHIYLTLKDGNCALGAVIWKSAARQIKFAPANGLEVVATGSVGVYEPGGRVQFYVRKLEPRGTGSLELAFQQLYEKLKGEGLFDAERKRSLPAFAERIGVVTSATGAAVRDIIEAIAGRFPPAELIVLPVRVQGKGASEEIARAVDRFNELGDELGGIDLLIVGRGGGSLEDLWAFNEEALARAISRSKIPVISAVGHEIDVTISDLVADARAPTPTAAGELAVPSREAVAARLVSMGSALIRAADHSKRMAQAELSRLEHDALFRRPESLIYRGWQLLDEQSGRLRTAPGSLLGGWHGRLERHRVQVSRIHPALLVSEAHRRLNRMERVLGDARANGLLRLERIVGALAQQLLGLGPARSAERGAEAVRQLGARLARGVLEGSEEKVRRLGSLTARLESCSHRSVLGRGFSLTRERKTGKIVRGPSDVRPGTLITTQLRDGEIDSRVEGDEGTNEAGSP